MIFLGGFQPRLVHFRAPGPMHHARWMSKMLYSIKVWMFRCQFYLTKHQEQGLRSIAVFAVRLYTRAWKKAPLAAAAPRNDLALLKALNGCGTSKTANAALGAAVLEKLMNHLWYLSEELVSLAFFDVSVPSETKRRMAEALQENVGSGERCEARKHPEERHPRAQVGELRDSQFAGLLPQDEDQ